MVGKEVTLTWRNGQHDLDESFHLYYMGGWKHTNRTAYYATLSNEALGSYDLRYTFAIYMETIKSIMSCHREKQG